VLETLRTDNIATQTELVAVRSRLAAAVAAEAHNGASTSQRDAQASKAKQEMRSLYNDLKRRAEEEEKSVTGTQATCKATQLTSCLFTQEPRSDTREHICAHSLARRRRRWCAALLLFVWHLLTCVLDRCQRRAQRAAQEAAH
jgi:hypothetical protein